MSNQDSSIKPTIVDLCGNGCCPKADFSKENEVTITDKGQSVVITKDQITNFVKELLERGFLD